MIYGDFVRVNEIDAQILDLHENLSRLYSERLSLLQAEPNAKPLITDENPRKVLVTKSIYEEVQKAWLRYNVKLPKYQVLKSRLEQAEKLSNKLQKDNAVLSNAVSVLIVPPYRTLQKALRSDSNTFVIKFEKLELESFIKKSHVWQVVVVINKQLVIYSQDFDVFMDQKEFMYESYDCRALGVQELLAGGLQTGIWPEDNKWVLLLKNITGRQVLCAIKQGNQITIDTDYTDALLGENYFNPAIFVSSKSRGK